MVFAVYISMEIGSCKAKPCMERTRYPCSCTLGKSTFSKQGSRSFTRGILGKGCSILFTFNNK